jgi:hypothetical protein
MEARQRDVLNPKPVVELLCIAIGLRNGFDINVGYEASDSSYVTERNGYDA